MAPSDFRGAFGFAKPLPTNLLVFTCRSGARAEKATVLARARGFNARNFRGSFVAWFGRGY